MLNNRIVVKDVQNLSPQLTSHGIGSKLVLLANHETNSAITQIAMTTLLKGEFVESHAHPTMDEHFLIVSGEGKMFLDGDTIQCVPGRYILVPATLIHGVEAVKEMYFLTIGVSTNDKR